MSSVARRACGRMGGGRGRPRYMNFCFGVGSDPLSESVKNFAPNPQNTVASRPTVCQLELCLADRQVKSMTIVGSRLKASFFPAINLVCY